MSAKLVVLSGALFALAWQASLVARADDAPSVAQIEFFENKIRPILANRCYKCHSGEVAEPKGGLRVDSRDALVKGGDAGPAIVERDPDESYLVEAIGYGNVDLQMPPKGKLPDAEIDAIKQWIREGAAWPKEEVKSNSATKKVFDLQERKASHWAWQPVKPVSPPDVNGNPWVRDPIDPFVLAKVEAAGLTPAAPAERRTWLRRVSFDLVGLPPSPAEIAAFEADTSADAFEKVVDRLLASPHFGERWGRHWLDLVRYAESYGHEFDYPIADAWRYRDYVIRAFNADLPYDQFVTEQIAGDLMPQPRMHPTDGTNESIVGTAFWLLGEQTHAPVDLLQHQADRIDNQIDVMGKTFLGLTLGRARCHDHKFDAISQKDVYALWGFMQSSRQQHAFIDPQGKIATAAGKLQTIRAEGDAIAASVVGSQTALADPPATSPPADDKAPVEFESFNRGLLEGWYSSGLAFGDRPTQPGSWDSFSRTPQLAAPGIAHSGMVSRKLTGVLRSKTFTITHPEIWCRLAGQAARVRLIIDGYRMNEFNALLFGGLIVDVKNDQFTWQSLAGALRKYLGHRAYIEIIDDGDGYVAVDRIVFTAGGPPADEPQAAAESLALNVSTEQQAKFAELKRQLEEVEQTLPQPVRALAFTDGDAVEQSLYVRGSHKNPAEVAPRRFLEAIAGADQPSLDANGSGRLELARRILDPGNPLTARVMVNRIWHHLFGRGLVASTDNFGVLGQQPTHPELLDHLADRFVREGWSIKRMIRVMTLSSTYRMGSTANDVSRQADPQNLLLSRMSIRRLEGEVIRDAMLAVSGRLDPQQFGPSVPVHLTEFMQGRGRPGGEGGPLDGAGRRSVYLQVRRNFLSPMMMAFDAPIPFNAVGTRNVSNVPAQALTLMNDPFVASEAKRWAQRMIAEESGTPETRITRMYETALARPPRANELAAVRAFLDGQSQGYGVPADQLMRDERPWSDLAHVLFNCKEFIFIE